MRVKMRPSEHEPQNTQTQQVSMSLKIRPPPSTERQARSTGALNKRVEQENKGRAQRRGEADAAQDQT